tara:strand:- start:94 stop:444 length:351 start_codon:yes stop_codon:yes gene_type:complete
MAVLSVQDVTEAGLTPSFAAATNGTDNMINTGVEFLVVKNGHGSATRTVTVTAQTTSVDDAAFGVLAKSNVAKTIAAGAEAYIGPFPVAAFNNASSQIVITYSDSAADITIGAFKL